MERDEEKGEEDGERREETRGRRRGSRRRKRGRELRNEREKKREEEKGETRRRRDYHPDHEKNNSSSVIPMTKLSHWEREEKREDRRRKEVVCGAPFQRLPLGGWVGDKLWTDERPEMLQFLPNFSLGDCTLPGTIRGVKIVIDSFRAKLLIKSELQRNRKGSSTRPHH